MLSRNLPLIVLLFASLAGQAQTKRISGYYSSNFGVIGMFRESIEFFPDSTFEYRFWGDMQNYKRWGKYKMTASIIKLNYYPKNDTAFFDKTDWVTSKSSPPLIVPETIKNGTYTIDSTSHRPTKWFYKRGRLYDIDDDGSIGSEASDGTGSPPRRYFLAKSKRR